ncbi:hypothetical protein J2S07_001058 [Robertmurraya andreesenii]|uniref:Uncharacterized protein n=1 Tax=Anoxybacillus andreesenii TaxID=1325932 RepID=A0ABT9V1E1_9BACL|nr:hypothetical protein [Robertmurraya andreesenii]
MPLFKEIVSKTTKKLDPSFWKDPVNHNNIQEYISKWFPLQMTNYVPSLLLHI